MRKASPSEKNYVVFDDPVRLNLETKYIKQIDVAFMRKLKSSIGQLLYTKLSHLLHEASKQGRQYVDVEYTWLSERMGIKTYRQIWEAKRQLKRAIDELVREHYIKEPQWHSWTIRFQASVRHEMGERAPREVRKRAARKAPIRKAILKSKSQRRLNRETLCFPYATFTPSVVGR